MRFSLMSSRGDGSRETIFESIESGLDFGLDGVVESLLHRDVFQDRGIVGLHELQELALEAAHFGDGNAIGSAAGRDINAEHLLLHGGRHVLLLLLYFGAALPASDTRFRVFTQRASPLPPPL